MSNAYIAPGFSVGAQFFTNQGVVLAGGLIYTYAAGSITPQATYTDSTATVPNTNPIVLDSSGRLTSNVWIPTGLPCKFVLETSTGSTQGVPQDYVYGVNDPLNAALTTSTEWTVLAAVPTYISATQFSLPTDFTGTLTPGRRVRLAVTAGTAYGSVVYASLASNVTTVTVVMDSLPIDSGITVVSTGLISQASMPRVSQPGEISHFAWVGSNPPLGFLVCNGAAISRTVYSALYAALGTTWGSGDGSTTFNIPEMRGEFIRNFDNGRGVDTGRVFATDQAADNAPHTHGISDPGHLHSMGTVVGGSVNTNFVGAAGLAIISPNTGTSTTGITTISQGAEGRPRNVTALACIRY